MTSLPDPGSLSSAPAVDPVQPLARRTGLESQCLRQAIHDLRGSLNTSSVLLDLVVALSARDPNLASAKVQLVVRELQSTARMLDHLAGTSESLASELVPLDLGAAVAAASNSSSAAVRGVAVGIERQRRPSRILSCPQRLPRALALAFEKCIDALPDGGSIDVTVGDAAANPTQEAAEVRLALVARGGRVLGPPEGRPRLHASKDPAAEKSSDEWFPLLALVRGVGGDVHIQRQGSAELRLLLDFPRGTVRKP